MRPKTADNRKPPDERKGAAVLAGHGKWNDEVVRRPGDGDRAQDERQIFERIVWDEV